MHMHVIHNHVIIVQSHVDIACQMSHALKLWKVCIVDTFRTINASSSEHHWLENQFLLNINALPFLLSTNLKQCGWLCP